MRIVILVLSLLAASVLGARAERQDEQFSEQEEERVKRFIYYKDTKWCGIGNRARNYHDLGKDKLSICSNEGLTLEKSALI